MEPGGFGGGHHRRECLAKAAREKRALIHPIADRDERVFDRLTAAVENFLAPSTSDLQKPSGRSRLIIPGFAVPTESGSTARLFDSAAALLIDRQGSGRARPPAQARSRAQGRPEDRQSLPGHRRQARQAEPRRATRRGWRGSEPQSSLGHLPASPALLHDARQINQRAPTRAAARVLAPLDSGDVLMVQGLDRLAAAPVPASPSKPHGRGQCGALTSRTSARWRTNGCMRPAPRS
jgi:hypothetical protein